MSDLDRFTLDELHHKHGQLHDEGCALHAKFMALPSRISEDANILMAKCAEISEMMRAVYVEIVRRDTEHAHIYKRGTGA